MKIILSVDPIRYPLTGIGRYTYELAHGLKKLSNLDVRFMQGAQISRSIPGKPDSIGPDSVVHGLKSHLIKSSCVVDVVDRLRSLERYRALRKETGSVFHGPNFYLPRFAGPSVVTIHDLSIFLWPECHPAERVRYLGKKIKQSLQRANVVITDSEYTRNEVASYFGWPLERIVAIPLAAGAEFRPRSEPDVQTTLNRYGLKYGSYCLFSGTIEPRKNVGTLLDAFEMLPSSLRTAFPLVLCGYNGWNNEDIRRRIGDYEQKGWLRYLGYVPSHDLPIIFSGARLFVFPSKYEGFGLPVLEAMASGLPVICSNATSLPEVAGDAAANHHPDDPSELADLLSVGFNDPGWCSELAGKALRRAESFSWDTCALNTLNAYRLAQKNYG